MPYEVGFVGAFIVVALCGLSVTAKEAVGFYRRRRHTRSEAQRVALNQQQSSETPFIQLPDPEQMIAGVYAMLPDPEETVRKIYGMLPDPEAFAAEVLRRRP